MSSPSAIQWFHSREKGQYYYWSSAEQCFVFQDGTRARPDQSALRASAASQTDSAQRTSTAQTTPRRIPGSAETPQQQVTSITGLTYASSSPTTYQLFNVSSPPLDTRTSDGNGRTVIPAAAPASPQSRPGVAVQGDPTYSASSTLGRTSGTVAGSTPYRPTATSPSGRQSVSDTPPRPRASTIGSGSYSTNSYDAVQTSPAGRYPLSTDAGSQDGRRSVSALTSAVQNASLDPANASPANAYRRPGQSLAPTSNVQRRFGEDAAGVRYDTVDGPPEAITDPELFRALGVSAHMRVRGTPGDAEFDESYRVRKQPSKFFVAGKVFMVLWPEPAGTHSDAGTDITRDVRFNQRIHSKVRRFVVIRAANNYSSAIPILSHGNQGVAKTGLQKSDFAVIYTGKAPPDIRPDEHPSRGENPLRPLAIRVDPDEKGAKLSAYSRLNFGKVYTIEHNVKVKSWGMVNRDSMQALLYQFKDVWLSTLGVATVTRTSQAALLAPQAPSSSTGQTVSGAPQPQRAYAYPSEQQRASTQASAIRSVGSAPQAPVIPPGVSYSTNGQRVSEAAQPQQSRGYTGERSGTNTQASAAYSIASASRISARTAQTPSTYTTQAVPGARQAPQRYAYPAEQSNSSALADYPQASGMVPAPPRARSAPRRAEVIRNRRQDDSD